jgi:pyrroloquinoline quinone biosynthesis protein E
MDATGSADTRTQHRAVAAKPPLWLLAELTYRCPLHCAFCSNPVDYTLQRRAHDRRMDSRVPRSARDGRGATGLLGRRAAGARRPHGTRRGGARLGFYTNLITSGVGLTPQRAEALKKAGLDHIQLSFQDSSRELNDFLSSTKTFDLKQRVARTIKDLGYPMVLNCVMHRYNLPHVGRIIEMAESMEADFLELANVQYYGWAWRNREMLMPTRAALATAEAVVDEHRPRLDGRMKILWVVPDYAEGKPKPCMAGWASVFLVVAPDGVALPCHSARMLPGLDFPSVREHSIREIWQESPAFGAYRGTGWMSSTCQSCEDKEKDHGGCRCQAFSAHRRCGRDGPGLPEESAACRGRGDGRCGLGPARCRHTDALRAGRAASRRTRLPHRRQCARLSRLAHDDRPSPAVERRACPACRGARQSGGAARAGAPRRARLRRARRCCAAASIPRATASSAPTSAAQAGARPQGSIAHNTLADLLDDLRLPSRTSAGRPVAGGRWFLGRDAGAPACAGPALRRCRAPAAQHVFSHALQTSTISSPRPRGAATLNGACCGTKPGAGNARSRRCSRTSSRTERGSAAGCATLYWFAWEQRLSGGTAAPPGDAVLQRLVPRYRVLSHYLHHGCWLRAPTLLARCAALPAVPTLIVHGTRDAMCPPQGAQALARVLHGRAILQWAQGAGHDPTHPALAAAMRQALRNYANTQTFSASVP